ncbi:MAG: tyrosine-type recombinase/integrase, partial [Alphaproteobacteria bacterium]|nr:tyrosine-type recombinase/integrase [Alphaproteobacteria bacterium]
AIKQGLDLYQVAKLLGHKNIRTTTRYAHLAREDLIKASNVVGGVFVK